MHPLIIPRFALAVNFQTWQSELHFEGFGDVVNLSSLLSSPVTKPCALLLLLEGEVQKEGKV